MSAAKLTDVISNLANGNISVQADHSASQNDHGEGTSQSPEVAAAAEKAAKDNSEKRDIALSAAIQDMESLRSKCDEYKTLARATEISAEQNKHSKPMIKRSIGYTIHMIFIFFIYKFIFFIIFFIILVF